jgi:ATP-dependent 26S proteasome regulatory subunit
MTVALKDLVPFSKLGESQYDLLPSQSETFEHLVAAGKVTPVTGYNCLSGMGCTELLRKVAKALDGLFIDLASISDKIRCFPAQKWEEAVFEMIEGGLHAHHTVVIDDLQDICGIGTVRDGLFLAMRQHFNDFAIRNNYRLIFGGRISGDLNLPSHLFGSAAAIVTSGGLTVEDYGAFFARRLGQATVKEIDFARVHRTAPMLDLYQLHYLANLLRVTDRKLTTTGIETLIETRVLHGNVQMAEVEELRFDSLPGSEHIAEALETHIVLPLLDKTLAEELDLKPKRGVLLYGPPGTGKTSIGRALAHRISGRFFLIDGSYITEPPTFFFDQIAAVVEEAKRNAPSVLFIDDADVLFQIEHIAGLSRYLLSLLDGIESERAGRVCVMMTAMDASKVPDALLRSGRVELWLETVPPDEPTRARILKRWVPSDVPGHELVDYDALASQTAGFTPADLRRLASDAKLLYAADVVAGRAEGTAADYLRAAITDLVALRATMAQQLADDSLRVRAYA